MSTTPSMMERAMRRLTFPYRFLQRHARKNEITRAIQRLRDDLAFPQLRDIRITDDAVFLRVRDGREFYWDVTKNQSLLSLPFSGTFEEKESAFVGRLIRPGWIVADVGANFGWYTTLLATLVGDSGEVHSFEPVPAAAEILHRNVELNHAGARVRINRFALGDKDGVAQMCIPTREGSGTAWASLRKQDWGPHEKVECRVTTLADYYEERGLNRLDFVKCDVEGAELLVLRGAERIFERGILPTILFEYAPELAGAFGHTAAEIESFLGRFGYALFTLDAAGRTQPSASLASAPREASFVASVRAAG